MSHHRIKLLKTAAPAEPPAFLAAKKRRPRGAKGAGLKFEEKLKLALGKKWLHGQWFRFIDASGIGWCQTDSLYIAPDGVYCIEAKLGNIEAGIAQFKELYEPVLWAVYGRPVFLIVAARYLSSAPRGIFITSSLLEAIEHARIARLGTVLHWRERYPLEQAA